MYICGKRPHTYAYEHEGRERHCALFVCIDVCTCMYMCCVCQEHHLARIKWGLTPPSSPHLTHVKWGSTRSCQSSHNFQRIHSPHAYSHTYTHTHQHTHTHTCVCNCCAVAKKSWRSSLMLQTDFVEDTNEWLRLRCDCVAALHANLHVHTHTHIHLHWGMCTCTRTSTFKQTIIYMCICIHMCICVYTSICVYSICVYTSTCTQTSKLKQKCTYTHTPYWNRR